MEEQLEFLQQPEPEFHTLVWRFANTMKASPHWYVVRSPENETEYVRLFHRIANAGSWENWNGRRYRYYYAGGWEYWAMTNEVAKSQVINRAKA